MARNLLILSTIGVAGWAMSSPATAQNAACRDPWVTRAVQEVYGRPAMGSGELGDCNIQLYGARWASYEELKGYVQQTKAALQAEGLQFRTGGRVLDDGKQFAAYAGFYVGAADRAPRTNWTIALPGGNVLAVERRCRRGGTPSGPTPNAGCVYRNG